MTEIFSVIPQAERIVLYADGAEKIFTREDAEFLKIMAAWAEMVQGAHQMPAFGVSIDRLTRGEMKSGHWLEFFFAEKYESNGLPFDSLLFVVRDEYKGINLVRRDENGLYQGRCIYIDLNGKDMSALAAVINNIVKQER